MSVRGVKAVAGDADVLWENNGSQVNHVCYFSECAGTRFLCGCVFVQMYLCFESASTSLHLCMCLDSRRQCFLDCLFISQKTLS